MVAALAASAAGTGCDGPALHVAWTITLDGHPATCEDVGAWSVTLWAESPGLGHGVGVPCSLGELTHDEVWNRSYRTYLVVKDQDRQSIAGTPVETVEVDGFTDLGTVDLAFGAGTVRWLRLRLTFGDLPGPYCDVGSGGWVNSERVYLRDVGGAACIALPIEGSGPPGYIDGDTCGEPLACVDPEDTLYVEVPAGTYELEVEGYGPGQTDPPLCFRMAEPRVVTLIGDVDVDLQVPLDPAPEDVARCPSPAPARIER